jgi:hypothetical protein
MAEYWEVASIIVQFDHSQGQFGRPVIGNNERYFTAKSAMSVPYFATRFC